MLLAAVFALVGAGGLPLSPGWFWAWMAAAAGLMLVGAAAAAGEGVSRVSRSRVSPVSPRRPAGFRRSKS
jgi:hypothetical protein